MSPHDESQDEVHQAPGGLTRLAQQVTRSQNGRAQKLELHLVRSSALDTDEAAGLRCIAGLLSTHMRLLVSGAPVSGERKARLTKAVNRRFARANEAVAERFKELCAAQAAMETARGTAGEVEAAAALVTAEQEFEEAFAGYGKLL